MAGSGTAHMRNTVDSVLTVRDLTVEFRVAKDKIVKAVSGLSFDVVRGETLAIVGESGCGKTTLARAVLQLPPPNAGEVVLNGTDLTLLPKENLSVGANIDADDLSRSDFFARPTHDGASVNRRAT